jgi:hypothetical protein
MHCRNSCLQGVLGAGVIACWDAAVVEGDAAHATGHNGDDAVDCLFSQVNKGQDTGLLAVDDAQVGTSGSVC